MGLICALLSALGTNLAFLFKLKGRSPRPMLALTAGGGSGAHSDYSLAGMIIFEGIAVGVGLLLVLSHLTAAVLSFYASARSLQIGDGVAVIAVTSVAANLSTIVAGWRSSETDSAPAPS